MKIFETYTGNAMLNNALMTIEALAELNNVSEITPELLLELFQNKNLPELNKRLKSYTMLFSLNNPLVNPAKKKDDVGEITYKNLLTSILKNCEFEGSLTCEISGLKFEKPFESFYEDEIKSQKEILKEKKIDAEEEKKQLSNLDNTDFSLNRTWFPLIGGLGSDAQALPQAKFSIQIHPICIVILQFLPLSALLYKGGILLIDSSNFEFSKRYVLENCKTLKERIETKKSNEPIENVKDFSKGNYILKALKIFEDKNFDDEYSDLNLWSFSNSGTGASCEIDRIPNSLFRKLNNLYNNPSISLELKDILNNNNLSNSFLTSLENDTEWWLLYPNVFKKVKYEGVSVNFLEAYFKAINSKQKIKYAKYLAYLINKYKSKYFEKYLNSTTAWDEKEYRIDLYAVLVEAAKGGEWNLHHHFKILDDANQLPVKNTFYDLHKLIHFYYQKKVFDSQIPELKNEESLAKTVVEWLIRMIQNDINNESIIRRLKNAQEYSSVRYSGLMLRAYNDSNLNIETIINSLYDDHLNISVIGLNELLRLFFSQYELFNIQTNNRIQLHELEWTTKKWIIEINNFVKDYRAYYFDKYENKETGTKPLGKFLNLINDISLDNSEFLYWFKEAIENTNNYLITNNLKNSEEWSEGLLYNPDGEFAIPFAKFAIKFLLLKEFQPSISEQNQTVIL